MNLRAALAVVLALGTMLVAAVLFTQASVSTLRTCPHMRMTASTLPIHRYDGQTTLRDGAGEQTVAPRAGGPLNPVILGSGAHFFAAEGGAALEGGGSAADQGIIYLRTDESGGLKPYIGQAKNLQRYEARQAEHAAANPDAQFNFEILEQGLPQSELDRYEQFYINAYGGPTTKLFTGELSNARNQMSWLRYMLAGGSAGIG